MKLIVGLGNPGKEYENTRHNIGFMILDSFLKNEWKNKFEGMYQIQSIDGEKVLFLKPLTYMNNSGISVSQAVNFYNISPEDILIIHDDMDLPFQTFKLKVNSSSGGHNGIKSIIQYLKTQSFCRLKIGISHSKSGDTINYVLGKFTKEEREYIDNHMDLYFNIISSFIKDGFDKTVNYYQSRDKL